ncbi:MAG: NAD-dependent epimerase/dehydratase family protein [Bacteroidales bacterium]|nr:NAD-dependent epimerase/dehydratase family protein [Bacteroidales bacterium]
MKKAVVFGATGLVGKEVVKQLLTNDIFTSVTSVVRRDPGISDPKLKILTLPDFGSIDFFAENLVADVYFICIGTTIKKAGTKESFFHTDHDIPLKIAHLAERLNIPVVSVISSIGAKSTSSNFYLSTKGKMEQSVKEAYSGNLQIARPSLLLGKREEFRFGERAGTLIFYAVSWLMVGPLRKYRGVKASVVAAGMISNAINILHD